jgi:hypothetical protein
MQNYDNRVYDGECACLPDIAWLLVIVALLPHLLGLVGTAATAAIASCACFPASMGPFAVVHAYLLIGRLGYISHMSWISAISFSLLWSAFLCCAWRKSKTVTVGIGVFCFIVSAVWIWQLYAPLS